MSRHTPGPWHVGGAHGRIIYDASGLPVADATVFHGFDGAVERATHNARLIAAAPTLLAALKELQANPNDPRAHRGALDVMRLAEGSL